MSEISIAIPCHDRGENGPRWLGELLNSIKKQTFQDIDIVISDQSKNDLILNTCKAYSNDFEFTYVRYEGDVPCENINVALENCEGRIIKVMFSDDIFLENDALEIIHEEYKNPECKWAFNGFCELKNGELSGFKQPMWSDYTLEGRNLLSSPSAVSFLNECKVEFDTNLKLLLDTDFYHRMRWNNGMPKTIPGFLIANRHHDDRVSSQATSQYDCVINHPSGGWMMNSKELKYVQEKYPEFIKNRKYPDEN
jgi:glycosyltransferase involved in cell wall biosynthesis